MDYQDVYYVTDGRNAGRDHRPGFPVRTATVVSAPPAAAMTPATPVSVVGQYQYPQTVAQVSPQGWTTQGWTGWGYPVHPAYALPPMPPASNLSSIIGGFGDLGSIANIAAQIFAALLPLPAAPTPQDGHNSESTDAANASVNSSNLIRYQNALALFARRDQQILTIGSVLKELLKRPGFPSMFGA